MSTDPGVGPPAAPGAAEAGGDRWDAAEAPRLTRRRFALHGGSTGSLTLPDHLATAQIAGCNAVEIADDELTAHLAQGGTLADVRTRLAELSLDAVSLYDASGRMTLGAWDDHGVREPWRALCERAAAIGCAHVIVTPGREREAGSPQPGERAAALAAMAEVAAGFARRTALEFRGFPGGAARSLGAARELLDAAGVEARLVIDAFHFHCGGSTWAMLDGLDAESIALVRLVDADARPPETLTDTDRLPSGDGVIPLRDLVRRVEALAGDVQYSVNLGGRSADPRNARGHGHWGTARLATIARENAEALCAEVDEQDGRLDYA